MMYLVFRCEALSFHDYSFLLDVEENNHTIVGVAVFEQFDYVNIKTHILEKLQNIHKCKSSLVKRLGVYWFQEMSDAEWGSIKGSLFRQEDNVHTDAELNDLVCKEQAIYEDFRNRPQYKFILIPEFQPGKSVMIMKVHHCFSDGLGLATLFQCLTDHYDPKNLPAMKPVGFFKNFFIHLISPFLVLQCMIETSLQPEDVNAINNGQNLSGIKTGGFSYDLDLSAIKAYCKSVGCTINDYTSSLLSVALHEYSVNEEKRMQE